MFPGKLDNKPFKERKESGAIGEEKRGDHTFFRSSIDTPPTLQWLLDT
jgi:hypothetical protein